MDKDKATFEELQTEVARLEFEGNKAYKEAYELQQKMDEILASDFVSSGLIHEGIWTLRYSYAQGTAYLYSTERNFPTRFLSRFKDYHSTVYLNDKLNTHIDYDDGELRVHSKDIIAAIELYGFTVTEVQLQGEIDKMERDLRVIKGVMKKFKKGKK